VGDLFVRDGVIADPGGPIPDEVETVDANGLWLAPGFWDIHVHLREPGGEEAETIASGSASAVRGGFTTIVGMPNTIPALDTPERVAFVLEEGRKADLARVHTTGCITRGRAGSELAPLAELADAGAVAFTDDGCTVPDDALLRKAMETARDLDLPIMDHAQDSELEKRGVMHEGEFSRKHELPGIPSEAEERIVARDAALTVETGCRFHIQHITSGGSVRHLEEARARGARITGELTPHHLALCDAAIDPKNANYKMNPPLRSSDDRNALTRALLEGRIEIFATDHAPHTETEKGRGFLEAPFGVLGLETAIGITHSLLLKTERMKALDWVSRWTTAPANIIGLTAPSLAPGSPADLVLIDPGREWVVNPGTFASRSRNTPFTGWKLTGRPIRTIRDGRTVWQG
jgi:dihydroorotase